MSKSEKLFDAITNIRDDILRRAEWKPRSRRYWPAAVAAVLVVAMLGGVMFWPAGKLGSPLSLNAYAVAVAEYPEMVAYPKDGEGSNRWMKSIQAQRGPEGYADGLEGFFAETMQEFLSDSGGENVVYSPLNVYMALAMLAETTSGESRQQILNLLGHDSMDTLRQQASILWNANYRENGTTTSVLASSVWLNEDLAFHQDTLETLAENYYASSYQGEMGSEEFDKALQTWLNAQTGGLLAEQAAGQKLDAETAIALATTVYFRGKWDRGFNADNTTQQVFHAENGDVTVDFMRQSDDKYYYWGDRFSAMEQTIEFGGSMWFILPDEGVSVDDLLGDTETQAFIQCPETWDNSKYLVVNEYVPKFDIASKTDFVDNLKELGITDVFDAAQADFSPVTDAKPVWVDKVDHAARVIIDEEGVKAAAYTVIEAPGAAPPPDEEVDFVLDRPFLFVLTGLDGLPLFVGVVNNPAGGA